MDDERGHDLTVDAVLFDLDGVLVDSGDAVERHWTAFAQRHGFPVEPFLQAAQGRRSVEVITGALAPDLVDRELRWFDNLEVADVAGIVQLPGAAALLAALPPDRWIIVTSCGRPLAEARLAAAGLAVPPRLVTSDEVRHGKPDPEGYVRGAAALGTTTSRCVVFEDAPSGIEAGRRAGATVVALATTYDAHALGADLIVRDLSAVTVVEQGAGPALRLRLDVG